MKASTNEISYIKHCTKSFLSKTSKTWEQQGNHSRVAQLLFVVNTSTVVHCYTENLSKLPQTKTSWSTAACCYCTMQPTIAGNTKKILDSMAHHHTCTPLTSLVMSFKESHVPCKTIGPKASSFWVNSSPSSHQILFCA